MTRKVFAKFDRTGSLDAFINNVNEVIALGAKNLFVLSAEKNAYDLAKLNKFLKSLPIPISGGIFPKTIFQTCVSDTGCIVCGSDIDIFIQNIYGLNDKTTDYAKALSNMAEKLKHYPSIIVLVDGTCTYISNFLEVLYQYTGKNTTYLGGGAGSLSLKPIPCLYSNEGLVNGCAQIVCLDVESIVCVQHGWEKLSGPYIITSSEDNTVNTIDFIPAFDFYRSALEKSQNIKITKENFFDMARNFPFGVEKIDGSIVVRDPISVTKDNGVLCVGDVIENSIVHILTADKKKLIESSQVAARDLEKRAEGKQDAHLPILLFDCITRQMYLEEKFSDELSQFKLNPSLQQLPVIGATTIGEISSYGMLSLEFFNKTLVAGLILKE